jgi:hypothetical protein
MRCSDAMNISYEGPIPRKTIPKGLKFDNMDIKKAFDSRYSSHEPGGHIGEFMRRSLSKDSDTLDVIAGVLTATNKSIYRSRFLCGLPVSLTTSSVPRLARSMMESLCVALFWDIVWDTKPERRSCFPSWTWAGWKLTDGHMERDTGHLRIFTYHHRTSVHRDCVAKAIEVEFVDGTTLSWEHQYERILGLSSSGIHPVSLKITGWTFHCQVEWQEGGDRWCKFTHPPRLQQYGTGIRPSGIKQRHLRQLLVLILLHTEDGEIQFLVIEQQENGDRFERLDLGTALEEGELIVAQGPERALWAEIELELKEICLV